MNYAKLLFHILVIWSYGLTVCKDNHDHLEDQIAKQLETPVGAYRFDADNLVTALVHVASAFKLPIGIAWINEAATRAPVHISVTNANVKDILDNIIQQEAGYVLQIEAGILNVFPAEIIMDQRSVLRVRLSQFQIKNQPIENASRQLRFLIRRQIVPAVGGVAGSQGFNIDEARIDLDMRDASVVEILNQLAIESERHIWIMTFTGDSEVTKYGFRRTMTIWNSAAIADEEQPVVDWFKWGEKLPAGVLRGK